MIRDNVKALAESYFTKHEKRTRRKDKDPFIERTKQGFRELGYKDEEMMIQKSRLGGKNLVVGSPDAEYLFTAHYDTPGRNGWFVLPFSHILGMGLASLLSQLFLVFLIAPGFLINLDAFPVVDMMIRLIPLVLLVLLFVVPNPRNHNDNTSGCIGVYNVAAIVAENPELRGKCAFVLFDMEEQGLFGSGAFARWRRKNYPGSENSCVINLDCIADGDILVLASKKKPAAVAEREKLAEFFKEEGFDTLQKKSNLFGYLSDHAKFKKGVMLAFLRRSKLGGLYIPNIHTSKDQNCDLAQIERLSESVIKYISKA